MYGSHLPKLTEQSTMEVKAFWVQSLRKVFFVFGTGSHYTALAGKSLC